MSILARLDLKGKQKTAAERLEMHLAVTAGAGSGKTRALVGRYLHFVEQGIPLRALVAITFTEKAAREMRARIRREIEDWLPDAGPEEKAAIWQPAYLDLDSAPIGTIHGLCADLLRLYPAEAGVDPRFTVLEEGRAAMLRAEAIETALAWATTDVEASRLFGSFKENELRRSLSDLLGRRLEALPALRLTDPLARWEAAVGGWFEATLSKNIWTRPLDTLEAYHGDQSDDKLETWRVAVLGHWAEVQGALAAGDWDAAGGSLRALRKTPSSQGQKGNWDASALEATRDAMRSLKGYYDDVLKPVVDGESRWALDQQAVALLPALGRLFDQLLGEYQALKDETGGLDFDDLESRAAQLLASGVAPGPGETPRAILVDEFQDTNDRQRQIVYALAGLNQRADGGLGPREGARAANLFIVGDAKQSIYRFRGADVTVFRDIQTDISQAGGEVINLDLTFRAHDALLETLAQLLAPLLGTTDDPSRPYLVPFSPLLAYRAQARAGVQAPFVEFQIGLGDAAGGRRTAAAALAARLLELQKDEGFKWEHMALLFRASTAFPIYEDALEAAGIPYVTVAGQGFYDRPEIRDLLNALTAIADPSDDLALAGLLRSPAFGLGDADLYALRFPEDSSRPVAIYQSLNANPIFSSVAGTITSLSALAGRLPIAELLKTFIDATHYRAILKSSPGGQRLSRNVDKLLADAHRSRLVATGDFLVYVQTLRDAGAREGEAPSAVGNAVQLMTIHRSKGLEFPLVVVADASHSQHGGSGESIALDPDLGVLLRLADDKARPLAWQIAALSEADREGAEDMRLLYVAATRAQEKLIFNGYGGIGDAQKDPGQIRLAGWLKQLGSVIGLDNMRITDSVEMARSLELGPDWAGAVSASLYPLLAPLPSAATVAPEAVVAAPVPGPLVSPFASEPAGVLAATSKPSRVWRVVMAGRKPPAWVVGQLVHEALRHWTFNLAPHELDARLRPVAQAAGLTETTAIRAALREARELLDRFRANPLYAEIDQAVERQHDLHFLLGDQVETIDVLYRLPGGWTVADFRTDDLGDEAELEKVLPQYRAQLASYASVAAQQLGLASRPRGLLIFLNLLGSVLPVTVDPP